MSKMEPARVMNRHSFTHLKRRRGALTSILLVVCALAGGLLYWQWSNQPLPAPETAPLDRLVRWLALHDLEREPAERQLALVNRLESELQQQAMPAADASLVPAAWLTRLHANVAVLKRTWFFSRVAQYADCPREQRLDFLRERLAAVVRWSNLTAREQAASPAPDHSPGLFADIEQWLAEAQGQSHTDAVKAVSDGVVCWLACYDLSDQPTSVRVLLANRIVQQLQRGQRPDDIEVPLDDRQTRQLVHNSELLMEAWTTELARQFDALPAHEHDAFVDRLLANINDWGIAELLARPSSTPSQAAPSRLLRTVNTWVDRAEADDKPLLRKLVKHVQYRVLVQQLRQWIPRGQSA